MQRLLAASFAFTALVASVSASAATSGFVDSSPTWAPKGTLIAFWRYGYPLTGAEAASGIYVVDSNGGDPRQVVADRGARWPWWSPDGGVIAYATEANRGSIQRVNLDGSERRRLSGKLQGYVSHPQWSPDGKRVAFHRNIYRRTQGRWRQHGEIWVVNAGGAGLHRVAWNVPFKPCCEPVPFSWSPTSDRLVYSGVQNGVRDLWTVTVDGRHARRLLRSRAFDSGPVWSPDGTRIAFTGRESNNGARIYVLPLGVRTLRIVGTGLRPRWDPASQRLAFIGTSAGVGVYVTTIGTGTAEKLFASNAGSGDPHWAPDGHAIVVDAYGECGDPGTGVYIITAGGSTRITNPCGA